MRLPSGVCRLGIAGNRGRVTDLPGQYRPVFTQEVVSESTTIVTVDGELDISGADALRAALDSAEEERTGVIRLDAQTVSFLDSTALGVVLAAAQRVAARGGRFELVCTSPAIRRVLDMTMISRTVHVLP